MPQKPHHQSVSKPMRGFEKLMRHAPTDAEAAMWRLLRHRRLAEFKFRRQVPFQNYILDFVCFDKRLVVEIDGSQHVDSERDRERDAALVSARFRIAHYYNNDVLKQPSSVLEDVLAKLTATDL